MFGLRPIQLIIIGGLLAVVLTAGGIAWIFREGKSAGGGGVKAAVQSKTIETLDAARAAKDKADAETRSIPYIDRVDRLR